MLLYITLSHILHLVIAPGLMRPAPLDAFEQADDMRTVAAHIASLRRGLDAMGSLDEFADAAARLSSFEDRLEKRVMANPKPLLDRTSMLPASCLSPSFSLGSVAGPALS